MPVRSAAGGRTPHIQTGSGASTNGTGRRAISIPPAAFVQMVGPNHHMPGTASGASTVGQHIGWAALGQETRFSVERATNGRRPPFYLSSVKRLPSEKGARTPRVRLVRRSSRRLASSPCAPPVSAPWAKSRPRPPLMVVERLPAAGGVSRAASPPGRSHSGDGESEPHGVLDDLLSLELLLWNG